MLTLLVMLCLLVPLAAACAPPAAGPSATSAPSSSGTPAGSGAPAAAPTREVVATQGVVPTPVAQVTAAPKPTSPAPTGAQPGGAITFAQLADAVTFHPYTRSDSPSGTYQGLVYGGSLVTYDPHTLELTPEAAKAWTISEDKLTYAFTLRDDFVWSDGTPVTSADYKWTYEQSIKPENKYPYVSNLAPIASYEAPDPRTIVVRLKEPLAIGLETAGWAVTPLPKHVWENLDWSDPQKNPHIMAPAVTSGAYKLQEWRKDERAVFVANDRYYDGKPLLETLTYRIVPSQEIAFQMLKTGEVDVANFTPDNYAEAKTLPNVTVHEWWPAAASWLYLGFNFRREPWQDVRVRQALSHAIDRDGIAEHVQQNLARPLFSPFPETSWVYNPDVPKPQLNMERAKELLDQAGWKPGPDGIRQKDGKPLTLTILFGPPTSKTFERVAEIAQQSWSDLGLKVEIRPREWGTYLSELRSEPFDWDVNVGAWNATVEPHFMQQIWLESSIPQLNGGAYVNKRVEELFTQGVREFDREKRKEAYGEIQRIMAEDLPYVFVTYGKSYVGVNNRIGGIEPTPLGITWNLERWYAK